MYSFQLPVDRKNRDGIAEGLLLFPHIESDPYNNTDLHVGFASQSIQDHLGSLGIDLMPIIPILNSEQNYSWDVPTAKEQSIMWPAFITGGRPASSAYVDGPSHYSTIFRSKWHDPNFLVCYIENFSLSGNVDRKVIENMQLCLGRVTVESKLLIVETEGEPVLPRSVIQA